VSQHPDFTSAEEADRWTGDLPGLFYVLALEAYRRHGGWVRRVLPRGAWVAMRVMTSADDFPRKELLISRREAPVGQQAEAAWARELDTFLKHAARHPQGGWLSTEDRRDKGSVRQFYVELYPLEVSPGRIRCGGDGCTVVLEFSLEGPTRCPACRQRADLDAVQEKIARSGDRLAHERQPYGGKA